MPGVAAENGKALMNGSADRAECSNRRGVLSRTNITPPSLVDHMEHFMTVEECSNAALNKCYSPFGVPEIGYGTPLLPAAIPPGGKTFGMSKRATPIRMSAIP
jgi:hypothetical protein